MNYVHLRPLWKTAASDFHEVDPKVYDRADLEVTQKTWLLVRIRISRQIQLQLFRCVENLL